jgi:hypothetical protein
MADDYEVSMFVTSAAVLFLMVFFSACLYVSTDLESKIRHLLKAIA